MFDERKREILGLFPFFEQADERLRHEIESAATLVRLDPGAAVFSEGGQCDKVVLLGQGAVRITKAGDTYLRQLLISCAHYQLGAFGPDTDLRRYGERIAARGGKNAKKRAVVAVARKLAVLLHRLWSDRSKYEALHHNQGRVAA